MSSIPLVINEWLIHDLCGHNEKERQMEAFSLLEKIKSNCDYIVILRSSPWVKKAYQLMKSTNSGLRYYSKYLYGEFIYNSLKCKTYREDEITPIPEDILKLVPEDDVYLISLCLTEPNSILVTSDHRLKQALSSVPIIKIELRDEFIKNYL
jgi:hypothetical protein